MSDHTRILSISGGGVKGLVPAKILHKISTTAGKNITDLFDCVIGTSIGGIIAISLTAPNEQKQPKHTTSDVVNLIRKDAGTIFPYSTAQASVQSAVNKLPFIGHYISHSISCAVGALVRVASKISNLAYPKYSRDGIDGLLDSMLGNATLNDTIPFAFQVPGSSAFGLQSQSRTLVYAPSTSPLGALLLAVHSTRLLEMLWVYNTNCYSLLFFRH